MLFERIRRGQKPVFIFLAVMFGLGFVALGVGSGASGINLGDILNTSSGGSGSISDPLRQDARASQRRDGLAPAGRGLPGRPPDKRGDRRLPAVHRAPSEGSSRPHRRRGAAGAAGPADPEPADQGPGACSAVHVAVDGLRGAVAEARTGALALGRRRPRTAVQHPRPDPAVAAQLGLSPGDRDPPEARRPRPAERALPVRAGPGRRRRPPVHDRGEGAQGRTSTSSRTSTRRRASSSNRR